VQAALTDIEMALGDQSGQGGIPADPKTGQPELLAARHPACGYAWPIPFGLQLRAEALLLQAAQQLGADSFVPAKRAELPSRVVKKISLAEAMLGEALELWQPLHDPEPERDDQNFKLNGKEYNYKATDTHRILVDLRAGLLTSYSLENQEKLLSDRGLTFGDEAESDHPAPQCSETVNIEPIDGRLKILFLAANPDDKTRLKLDEELRNIQDRIRETEFRDRIELTTRSALRHGDLRLALLEEKPHIVHGSVHDELILQDDDGSSLPVPRAALVSFV
jgi:hypothetical protein